MSSLTSTNSIRPTPNEDSMQSNSLLEPPKPSQHLEPQPNNIEYNWPYTAAIHTPALFNLQHLRLELQTFENRFLSKETAVRLLKYSSESLGAFEATLNAEQLLKTCLRQGNATTQIHFIHRFLIRGNTKLLPKDQKRLRISGAAFRSISEQLNCSPDLLSYLVDHGLPLAFSSRAGFTKEQQGTFDFWYTIPVRVAIPCTDQRISHALTSAGSKQTDPSQYLHLGSAKFDIRPSRIVVYTRYVVETKTTVILCFDFQDGRWVDYADEPFVRAKDTLKRSEAHAKRVDQHFMHVLLHSSAIIWWQESLNAYNGQLIEHEKILLRERRRTDSVQDTETVIEIDTALHTMAAHLHRYKAEVKTLEENIQGLSSRLAAQEVNFDRQRFDSITIRAQGLVKFVAELEMKTQTVIALSFNTSQMAIDRQIVFSSQSMGKIMRATQEEAKLSRFMAKQSQEIAEDTRKDSISMKAIALLTMLFLPGTAFAAILSMPFFDNEPWMGKASRLWVWFALTTPSTVLAVVFYVVHSKRIRKKRAHKHKNNHENDIDVEMEGVS